MITTAKRAKAMGFTHHGKLHGIPVWVGGLDTDAPMVQAKNWLYELALDLGEAVFGFVVRMGWAEPVYGILVGEQIG